MSSNSVDLGKKHTKHTQDKKTANIVSVDNITSTPSCSTVHQTARTVAKMQVHDPGSKRHH